MLGEVVEQERGEPLRGVLGDPVVDALEHLEAIVDGPTIVTLGNYLKEHFLGEAPAALDSKRIVDPKLQHRADTIFSDLLEETPKK